MVLWMVMFSLVDLQIYASMIMVIYWSTAPNFSIFIAHFWRRVCYVMSCSVVQLAIC